MKIFIDIGHPAHVHYFRNLIMEMSKNHDFFIVARTRASIHELLSYYNIHYHSRGKGKNSKLGKLLYMLQAVALMLTYAIQFKPDIFLSFSSPYAAQTSWILRKPHIALNDTEPSDKMHGRFTYPFSNTIIIPVYYQNDLGEKQLLLATTMEYFYLHPGFYTPNKSIFKLLNLSPKENYVIVRLVSWNAHHDYGQSGLTLNEQRSIIRFLSKHYQVFISSESPLVNEFEGYRLNIPAERMHDALAFATLFIGESATMASESAILGTHAVYVNSLPLMGSLKIAAEFGLLKHFSSGEGVLKYVKEITKNNEIKKEMITRSKDLTKNFINPTHFLRWFIEDYPASFYQMAKNADLQYKYK